MTILPIKLYSLVSGVNVYKVSITLEELRLPYVIINKELGDGEDGVKHSSYTEKVNPNGRVPAIEDPNNGNLIVWESAAILKYLACQYDKEHTLYPVSITEQAEVDKWLAYEISGLALAQSQLNWFRNFHQENLPSAVDRYTHETLRIYGVLNKHLANKKFFALNRFTIADIAFYVSVQIAKHLKLELASYPNVQEWEKRVSQIQSVKETKEPNATVFSFY